jgi:hypothetical protein
MMDFKAILLDILTAIGYSEDKEAFIEKFIKNVEFQSLMGLMQQLPQNKQEEIENQLLTILNDPQKVSETLKGVFSEEQIQQSLENATKDAVLNYITTVNDTLSVAQRENLTQTLERYSPSQPVPSSP